MKLTYWVATCVGDSAAYSLRGTTRKEVKAKLESAYVEGLEKADFEKPHKVTVEYTSAFDLLSQCLSEGGVYEGE